MSSVPTSASVDPDQKRPQNEPLAVIGIGCRLPGGINSPTAFWEALLRGIDAIGDVPSDRWRHERFHDPSPEKAGCIRNAKGGFIDGVDQFDAEFFGYFPTQAQRMDPQQRLLLEVTHEAMEDAGLRREKWASTRTAVFIGSFMYDWLCMQSAAEHRDEISPYVAMGTSNTSLANRISYDFDLKGPSVSLDTACSASLTAVHLACQSIWRGESDMAVAGGVNLMLRPESSIMLSRGGFLNSDQSCKAFDEAANGYVRGEGCGVVILKPLARAVADGDLIYACVNSTAVNSDGFTQEGFTVPNVRSQIDLLKTAYSAAGIDPASVAYVEAHGTGTPVGDPVESQALGAVLGLPRTPEQPNLMIGSVKTNLGHMEGTAGIAGFIKGTLTARHGVAPPNLHFHDKNPAIPWEHYRLDVPTQTTSLRHNDHPLTIGVNSFGAGGTNAHAVLQEFRDAECSPPIADAPNDRPKLYMLSARNRDALRDLATHHADFLSTLDGALEDAAFSAFTRRSRYENMLAVVGESAADVESQLRKFVDGQVDSAILSTTINPVKKPKLAFVFSGQGGQWARMGMKLMGHERVFREAVEEVDALFHQLAGWSLLAELRHGEDESRIDDTVVVQPAVMAIQVALVKLYDHYGIRPAGVVGHSIGEVAAAFAAGALDLQQAVQVIYHRSQAQDRASGKGGMLAVAMSQDKARALIEGVDGVSIAAVNGPEMLTLSGDPEPLEQLSATLESRGIFNRHVNVQVAYHSHHMDAIEDVMRESLAHVHGVAATTPLYSTVTGQREDGLHLNADYWFQNVRRPVLFADALDAMLDAGFDTFVEIGPHPVLIRGGESLFQQRGDDGVMVPAMTRREPEVTVFLQSLARLATRGVEPDVEQLYGPGRRFIRLPKNPWQHQTHWFEPPEAAELRRGRFAHPFLKRQTQMVSEEGLAIWEASIDIHKFPYLRDHQVDGEIVFPATGHIELAWAVASEQFHHQSFFIERLQFNSPLLLPENSRHPLDVRLEVVSQEGEYRICSRPTDAAPDTPWTRHSWGKINLTHDRFASSAATFDDVQKRFDSKEPVSVDQFYENVREAGLAYGKNFRLIQQLRNHENNWLAEVQLPDDLLRESQHMRFHPTLFDACVHVLFADSHRVGYPDRIYLPFRIDRLRVHRRPTPKVWAYVQITRNDDQYLNSDTLVFDEHGNLVAEVLGLVGKRLVGAGSHAADSVYEGCYEYEWEPAQSDPDNSSRLYDVTRAVIIANDTHLSDALSKRFEQENIKSLIVSPANRNELDAFLNNVPMDRRTLVVFAAGLATANVSSGIREKPSDWTRLEDCPSISLLLGTAQMIYEREGAPNLTVVTNGAGGVSGDRRMNLEQAILHGMARVVKNECPQINLTTVDLSPTISPLEIERLFEELLHRRLDVDETEVALRGGTRLVRKLSAVERDRAEQRAASLEEGVGGSYGAELTVPGVFERIEFRRRHPRIPSANEVEIEIHAAGLSFRDVLTAMGIVSEEGITGGLTEHRLGLEVAGRIRQVGCNVSHFQPGDQVIARVPEAFCGSVTTPAHCVARKPQSVPTKHAACIPLSFVTAWYSLHHLARIVPNETVLIHSAAGGVGTAAVQLAREAGATVIATAGTKEKRAYLKRQGVEFLFDSRSLDFYNNVMEVTDGRGVDVVLNSLAGHSALQSIKCLAPFGRFVELCRSDLNRNNKLDLRRLSENISYFAVDVDRLATQKPDLHGHIMTEVVNMFDEGRCQPLALTEFPIGRLAEALKFMARSNYQGKIIVNMQDEQVKTLPPRTMVFRADRSYLISGGASGFGLKVAEWMASRGARHLVLLSRNGPKTHADETAIGALKRAGVHVYLEQADVTDATAVRRVVNRIRDELPALAGIIHGAAVMDDASIPAMTMERFQTVFNPKAQGAWNLHDATLRAEAELDFFVMLSSISSVMGLRGQINYAPANFFLDSLSELRRQQELPATSINLGILGEYAGLSRTLQAEQDIMGLLESQGMLVTPLNNILEKLEAALLQQPAQRLIGRFDWSRFRLAYPHLVRDARYIEMFRDEALASGCKSKGFDLVETLKEVEPDKRQQLLEYELKGKLSQILDADPDKIEESVSIDVLGLDSLMLTDLQIHIGRLLDITLPIIKLLKGPSISSLAAELLTDLDSAEAIGVSSDDSIAFTLADLDDVHVMNPWVIRGAGSTEAPCRLICFHSMGVGASLFTNFLINPPKNFDILAVQTPGRENRAHEPVTESVEVLAETIVEEIQQYFDRPVVVWGHSFGGIVAWEVICRLRESYKLEPSHFVVTGTAGPHLVDRWQKREVLLKAMVADNSPEYLVSLSRYVDDPEFLKSIIPMMRIDYPLLKTYRFESRLPLSCPITAFAAQQDDFVYRDEILEWAQHTRNDFRLIEVDGDHWFLARNRELIVKTLEEIAQTQSDCSRGLVNALI